MKGGRASFVPFEEILGWNPCKNGELKNKEDVHPVKIARIIYHLDLMLESMPQKKHEYKLTDKETEYISNTICNIKKWIQIDNKEIFMFLVKSKK